MTKIALAPEVDEDADINKIEERDLETVTKKRDAGKNLLPYFFFGGIALVGLYFVAMGMRSEPAPRSMVPSDPVAEFSTGFQGTDTIPAFQRELTAPPPDPQPERERRAPPEDRSSSRADTLFARHKLEMEAAAERQRLQTQGARDAFELQMDQQQFQKTVEAERALRKRQAATALVFDDSKDQE